MTNQEDIQPNETIEATEPVFTPPASSVSSPPVYGNAGLSPSTRRSSGQFIVALGLVAILSAGIGGGVAAATVAGNSQSHTISPISSTTKTAASITPTGYAAIINKAMSSVVTISVEGASEAGTGSGVVLNNDGYIVTNAHVVTLEGKTASGIITVQTKSGNVRKATLIAYDATADLAVIRVSDTRDLVPMTFADSSKVSVGDSTIAIGSPLGLSGTVTTGIVSALNRPITVGSSQVQNPLDMSSQNPTIALNVIQTDAAINQGNSGGALLDANGNLIGINGAIASSGTTTNGNSNGNIGIGFAIPSNYVQHIATELITNKTATHGYLGASVEDASTTGSTFTTGALVGSVVTGSPADKAGLMKGDVITAVDGSVIVSATQFVATVKQTPPGTTVKLALQRGATTTTIMVDLSSAR